MNKLKFFLLYFLLSQIIFIYSPTTFASNNQPKFNLLMLGTSGGTVENNLSAYLLAPVGNKNFICLDAGSIMTGLENPLTLQNTQKLGIHAKPPLSLAGTMLTQHIQAYLLSHAHLDHISGLVINSPVDSPKIIMGIPSTLNYLKDSIFNWKIWANFANEGVKPYINRYHYFYLQLDKSYAIPKTDFTVKAFLLNHGNGYPSTAFLLKSHGYYVLYLGDTGADSVEKSSDLKKLWTAVAPIIRENKLRAMLIECSYLNSQPDTQLYGHLKPILLTAELTQLASLVDPKNPDKALANVKIIVTHIKTTADKIQPQQEIMNELNAENKLNVKFILPHQGTLLEV